MSKFEYKKVKVEIWKEEKGVYNFTTNLDGVELFGIDNLTQIENMEKMTKYVKENIDLYFE